MPEDLVDDLYEAAVAAERWPAVLEKLARLGGGAGASFVTGGHWPTRWIATPAMDELIRAYGAQPHPNPRLPAVLGFREPAFFSDLDAFTPEQMDSDPFYTEFVRPRGFGWALGTAIYAPGADPIIFSVERRHRDGPPERRILDLFDGLRPHLARSLLMTVRLGLSHARARLEALESVGYPAVLLDEKGRAILMNKRFEAAVPEIAADHRARLVLSDRKADQLFAEALAQLRLRPGATVQSIAVAGPDGAASAIAHLLPIRKSAADLLSPGIAILLLTPLAGGPGPSVGLLGALFDLSRGEARVARALAAADSLDAIARRYGVSKETVRAQLKSVFAKTGTRRQTELIRLLSAIPPVDEVPGLAG